MALTLFRVWGIRPHEHDAVPASVLKMTRVLDLAGHFEEPK